MPDGPWPPPPVTPADEGTPFQAKVHTANAILCGDFNLAVTEAGYADIIEPFAHGRLWNAWQALHGEAPQPPTFRLYDSTYGRDPIACDFVFVSDGLKGRLRHMEIDGATQASDHQPVLVALR